MKRNHVVVLGALVLGLASVAACVDRRDRCEGFGCPADRICIALITGPRCVCPDETTEVDGTCVDDLGGEGEGE